MLRHPLEGVGILRNTPFYEVAREIAGGHHEKWNGTGYPYGRRGESIPRSARIVAVADIFDALTTQRPYKDAWSHEAAVQELKRLSGESLDAEVVDAFIGLHEAGVVQEIAQRFPEA